MLFSQLLFDIVLKILADAIRQENSIRSIRM